MSAEQEYKSGLSFKFVCLFVCFFWLCYSLGYCLPVGGQNKGVQLQCEVLLCTCYPPALSALLPLLPCTAATRGGWAEERSTCRQKKCAHTWVLGNTKCLMGFVILLRLNLPTENVRCGTLWNPTMGSFGSEMRLGLVQRVAAGAAPSVVAKAGSLLAQAAAGKGTYCFQEHDWIRHGKKNGWKTGPEGSFVPVERPGSPSKSAVTVGRGRAASPTASQPTGILQLIAWAGLLHWDLLCDTR